MSKNFLFILALLIIVITAGVVIVANNLERKPPRDEIELAVNFAQRLYQEKKMRREDLSSGPCLSNALRPEWVADLVHSPREGMDDLVENQCAAYAEGSAKHFVELDLDGKLVKVK